MIKSLFIFALVFNSCASGNSKAEQKQDTLHHIKNEQSQTSLTSKKETVDSNFLLFWKEFKSVVKSESKDALKLLSLDSLLCEQKTVSLDIFLSSYYSKIFDDIMLRRIIDNSNIDLMDYTMTDPSLSPLIYNRIKQGVKVIKQVNITKSIEEPGNPVIIVFKFIETERGFKFYGYDKFG